MRRMLIAATLALVPFAARADGVFPPAADATVKKECGACHLAYSPQLLPSRSWETLMGDLANHFGEDASLDAATAKHIRDYLVAHAAETSWRGSKMMRGVDLQNPPLRISELPRFRTKHGWWEKRRMAFGQSVKSWADCVGCHRGAERGVFEEEDDD